MQLNQKYYFILNQFTNWRLKKKSLNKLIRRFVCLGHNYINCAGHIIKLNTNNLIKNDGILNFLIYS